MTSAIVLIENQTIIYFNKNAEKLWGFRKQIVIGKKLKYLFPVDNRIADDKKYLGNNLDKKLQKEPQFILDKELQQKDALVDSITFEIENKRITGFIIDFEKK